jgi:Asp-tRNA(Asn)/Glu-tRNA(Gln) amidotransferase C subunit
MDSHIKEEQQIGKTKNNKKIIFWILICLMLLLSALIMSDKALKKWETFVSRNEAYSLMPLVTLAELCTEQGGQYGGSYTIAQISYADMFQTYVDHTKNIDKPFLLKLLPSSQKDIVKCLEKIAEELREHSSSEREASEKIWQAAESIARFFSDTRLLTDEPVINLEPEVISTDIREEIIKALDDAHERAEIYAKNPTIAAAEEVCMANRRAIVYLYLGRFGYIDFIEEERLKQFRTDINRIIYYNRHLQQVDRDNHDILEKRSDSEVRRLRLLQAIIDNDIQEAQDLLKIAIMESSFKEYD